MTEEQDLRWKAVLLAGDAIRGDWSGRNFDGRDVQRWLKTAHSGTAEDVKELIEMLEHIFDEY